MIYETFFYLKVYWFSENLYYFMANYTLRFYDPLEQNEIECSQTELDKIQIGINSDEIGEQYNSGLIFLDISTAIKFSKELRRQIAIAKENINLKKEE